jgi:hypothetical protein
MGSVYFLTLIKSILPQYPAVVLFPAVMAWGAALNIAGIYVLSRWTFRVHPTLSLAGTAIIGVAINSLSYSVAAGFFSQVYGTASLAFIIAITSRCFSQLRWARGNALLIGLSLSILLSHYGEASPIIGLGLALCLPFLFVRANQLERTKKLKDFLAYIVLGLCLFANIEVYRTFRAIFLRMESSFGFPFPWTPWQKVLFAAGGWSPFFPHSGLWFYSSVVMSMTALLLLAVGLRRGLSNYRHLPIAGTCLVMTGLLAYYCLFTVDPWLETRGHTYNIAKICMCAFPLVAAIQIHGSSFLLRNRQRRRIALGIIMSSACICISIRVQLVANKGVVAYVKHSAGCDATLAEVQQFRSAVYNQKPASIYLIRKTGPTGWEQDFAPHALYPLPFTNPWEGGCNPPYIAESPAVSRHVREQGTIFLQQGTPPFEAAFEKLPFNHSRVDGSRALIFRADSPNGMEGDPGARFSWVGNDAVTLWVYSPGSGAYRLAFHSSAGPSLEPSKPRIVHAADGGDWRYEFQLSLGSEIQPVEIPLTLREGINQIRISCTNKPTYLNPSDRRVMLFSMVNARILGASRPSLRMPSQIPRDVDAISSGIHKPGQIQ